MPPPPKSIGLPLWPDALPGSSLLLLARMSALHLTNVIFLIDLDPFKRPSQRQGAGFTRNAQHTSHSAMGQAASIPAWRSHRKRLTWQDLSPTPQPGQSPPTGEPPLTEHLDCILPSPPSGPLEELQHRRWGHGKPLARLQCTKMHPPSQTRNYCLRNGGQVKSKRRTPALHLQSNNTWSGCRKGSEGIECPPS